MAIWRTNEKSKFTWETNNKIFVKGRIERFKCKKEVRCQKYGGSDWYENGNNKSIWVKWTNFKNG